MCRRGEFVLINWFVTNLGNIILYMRVDFNYFSTSLNSRFQICYFANFNTIFLIVFFLGEIYSRNLTNSGTINNFYHQHCTWILDSNVERQLIIEINTDQVQIQYSILTVMRKESYKILNTKRSTMKLINFTFRDIATSS